MKKLLLVLSVIIYINNINAKTIYTGAKVSRILRVIDGDTFACDIDSFTPIVGENISIRIRNIDTPELRSQNPVLKKLAYIEKERLANILKNCKVIEIKNLQRDKYFRIIADVYIDGKPLLDNLNKDYFVKFND